MYCKNCGKEIDDKSNFCMECGIQVPQSEKQIKTEKNESLIALSILSFLFPLVGLVLYLCVEKYSPVEANICAKWASIGIFVAVILSLIVILFKAGIFYLSPAAGTIHDLPLYITC